MLNRTESPEINTTLRCKVAVCGAPGVGKTSLIKCLLSGGKDLVKAHKMAPGIEVFVHPIRLTHAPVVVELFLFDTSGQELYWDLIPHYWNGITNAIIMYDESDKQSLKECEKWFTLVKQLRQDKREKLRFALVASKTDKQETLDDELNIEDLARSWADQNQVELFHVSALPPGTDFEEPFMYIANQFHCFYEEKLLEFDQG